MKDAKYFMACCYHIRVWIVWITAAGNSTNNQHRTSVIFLANGGEENEWGDNSDLVTYITVDTQSGSRAVGLITQFSPLSCWRFPSSFYSLFKLFKSSPQDAIGSSYASILPLAIWRWSFDSGTFAICSESLISGRKTYLWTETLANTAQYFT